MKQLSGKKIPAAIWFPKSPNVKNDLTNIYCSNFLRGNGEYDKCLMLKS